MAIFITVSSVGQKLLLYWSLYGFTRSIAPIRTRVYISICSGSGSPKWNVLVTSVVQPFSYWPPESTIMQKNKVLNWDSLQWYTNKVVLPTSFLVKRVEPYSIYFFQCIAGFEPKSTFWSALTLTYRLTSFKRKDKTLIRSINQSLRKV